MKVRKQQYVGGDPNLSEDLLSKWKQQSLENVASLFESSDKPSKNATERTTHLEQLVGRLTVELTPTKKPRRGCVKRRI